MNRSSWQDVAGVDGVPEKLWEDGERRFYRVWRKGKDGTRQRCLAVLPVAEHPTPGCLNRLAHEYGLKDHVDGAWALRPMELVREHGATVLVLEYHDGEPLDRLVARPMEAGGFLRLAVASAAAMVRLHESGLVHRDIKPANILVDPAGDRVWLMGFGVASRLPRKHQSPEPPELIAGTLSHMAPEQTGRMNRSIDSRSDLYSLGVTLYQVLTGDLPFNASDPLEWVHCHIARTPVAPRTRVDDVPSQLSAIVMKLLAKTPEERYQTAAGLERDLERCLADWDSRRVVDEFPLGELDCPDRLLIPEHLYGRQREVDTLLAAFDRVVNGGALELVLVAGSSGIGKSSVVNELRQALVPSHGLFASGKFDQYQRDIPYSTLAQAFQSLIRRLLGKSEAELSPWRDALRAALGPNAGLIAELVPDLKLIIGEPPPIPEPPQPHDAKRRFQLVFRQFVSVFARPEHPLALFLDDLQWLDAATLDLLEDLLHRSDLGNLLLLGAFRDNEVTAAHPLMSRLEAMRATGAVHDIKLGPLGSEDVGRLVADSLRGDVEHAAPLGELVCAKTDGNPFFVIQFLHLLADEGLLAFDHQHARWSWDLDRIHSRRYGDNAVELLTGRLARLPLDTQDALRRLACLGNEANVATLSIVLGAPEEQVHTALGEAVRQQLIDRLERSYKFVHDGVQEAAYALIPEGSRPEAHLTIGRLLATHTPPEKRDEVIFEIVNQLNRGAALITSREEREQLAELNLAAGKRAKASSAYASALTHLTVGAALLPDDAWERRQDLAFDLALQPADCEVCMGALHAAQERLAGLATRAVGAVQQCVVASRRTQVYTMLGEAERAVAVALDCLRHVGVDWQAHPTAAEASAEYERFWSRLGGRGIEDLVELPLMQDPEALATLDLLTSLMVPALYTDQALHALSVCRAANLSLERGNCDASAFHYQSVGTIASARFGHYDEGYRIGRMACDLIARHGWSHIGGRIHFLFANLVSWTRPFADALEPARRAFQMAKDHGDPGYAAFALRSLSSVLLALGHPLDQVEHESEQGLEFVRRFGFFLDRVSAPLALMRTLRGTTTTFGSLDDGRFVERTFEERTTGRPSVALLECFYWMRKLQARFFAGDYVAAIDAADRVERWHETSPALSLFPLEKAECHFYAALSRAAWCETKDRGTYATHRKILMNHERELRAAAVQCPQNFEDRAVLVSAEIARLEDRPLDAMDLYERAIASARGNGFVHNEALAYELAARFYAARGFEEVAQLYLGNARRGYLAWGADGKVRQLDQQHARLRQDPPTAGFDVQCFINDYYDAWRGTDEDRILSYYADDVTVQIPGTLMQGKAAVREQFVRPFITAFPGNRHLVKKTIPGRDAVIVEFVFQAEHTGAFAGHAATHARVDLPGCGVYEYDSAKRQITAAHIYFDVGTLLKQILDQGDGGSRTEEAGVGPTGTITAPVEHLDLATVIAVSQTVSGEMVLERLLDTLMRTAVEHAGAERALLILSRRAEQRVVAEATTGPGTVTVHLCDEPVAGSLLPETVLRYVLRTRESVILDDAAALNPFSSDSYLGEHDARSVFCLPLMNQAKLIGVLYLENTLAPGVFAPARAAVLKLLASQAAISIENSRLYRDLAERESRIRRMIEASIIGIFSWHSDGRVVDANAEFVRIIGHSREDLVSGRVRWTDFTLPEWRERDALEMEVLRSGRASEPQERELLRKDGTRVPVMTGGTMFEGSRDEGVAFVFDLTERKRAEQALRESERESRLVVNTIPGLVAALTPDGEVAVVNDQLVEYCGQGLEAMRQWGTNGTVHPEDVPHVAGIFLPAIASGHPYELEARVRRFDGVYRWFQIRGLPLRDTRGQVVRWYSLLSDIDDRKRAEVELRQAYDSFVDAQSLSKTGSFVTDLVGDDHNWSQEAYRIFEFDPATKVTVQRVRDVIHPDDLPSFESVIARGMTGANVNFAFRIVTSRGAAKHVRGVAHVTGQKAGHPLFVGALQDVTESVVAEEALNRARSELAHVTRLTTMGELTASIAHEVKQPIAAAVTSAQTALRWLEAQPPELGEVREALSRTVRAGKRAGDVVGQIRALVTKAPPRKDSVEINAAIREIVELTRGEAASNGVSLGTDLADDLPLIVGDRVQLQQVLLNLIMNGIEAMAGMGGIPRGLLISARKSHSEEVLVAVADTGPGLAAGALEQMFAAFYTTKPGGLGLGLSICRSIIEAHDGRLWASANDRGGAVFQFTLPAPPR